MKKVSVLFCMCFILSMNSCKKVFVENEDKVNDSIEVVIDSITVDTDTIK